MQLIASILEEKWRTWKPFNRIACYRENELHPLIFVGEIASALLQGNECVSDRVHLICNFSANNERNEIENKQLNQWKIFLVQFITSVLVFYIANGSSI